MTEQFATWLIVSFIIDPRNNYTWWDVPNNAASRREFLEAVTGDAEADHPRVLEAAGLADWTMIMWMLAGASKAFYR